MKKNLIHIILVSGIIGIGLTSCSNSERKEGTQSYSDSVKGPDNNPAPDNNSANNPSMADTAYKSRDTSHKMDTMHRK